MKKVVNSVIFKAIVLLLTICVMAIIVWFVYDYYNDLAKKGSPSNSRSSNNNSESNDEKQKIDDNDNKSDEEAVFLEYDSNRTRVYINGKSYILNVVDTDAGRVLSIGEKALLDYDSSYEYSYLVFDSIFVLRYNKNDNRGDNYIIVDDNLNDICSFKPIKKDNYLYVISKPIFDEFNEDFLIKDGNIYVTYVMDSVDDNVKTYIDSKSYVQFTYEVNYKESNNFNIISSYNFSDYLKNKY